MAIRVFIVEDHAVMRETMADYLALSPDLALCGAAASAEQALREIDAADPSVVILDVALPGASGLELLRQIRERWDLPSLVLSGHGERTYVERALAAGARGYVLKGRPAELPDAIRRVMAGEVYLSPVLRPDTPYEEDGPGT